jgi:hypothetical protein
MFPIVRALHGAMTRNGTRGSPPPVAPNAVLGAASFGTITTAGDPRVVQLAVKVVF